MYSYGGKLVRWIETVWAIFAKALLRNVSVIFFLIWASGSGGDVVKNISYVKL